MHANPGTAFFRKVGLMTDSSDDARIDILRAVAVFVGIVFASVTLWMGHQVSELTTQMARLTTVTEQQYRISERNEARIKANEIELRNRMRAIHQVEDLILRVKELEKRTGMQ